MTRRWPGQSGTPAQRARLATEKARADVADQRVMRRDPTWRPPSSVTSTLEGEIAHQEAVAAAAGAHHAWLVRGGIGGPGRFAVESFPAPIGRSLNRAERDMNDLFGSLYGCNTCGTFDPGSRSGHWFADHQPNTRWNPLGASSAFFRNACRAALIRADTSTGSAGGMWNEAVRVHCSVQFNHLHR